MAKNIKTLQLIFPNMPLKSGEIIFFRSFINDLMEWQNALFHNHTPDGGNMMRYPLIQFRSYKGKASLFGIEEGCEAISELIGKYLCELPPEMASFQLESWNTEIIMLDEPSLYYIHYFLPFNSSNLEAWITQKGLVNRVTELEKMIVNNILDFCQNIGFEMLNQDLVVQIETVEDIGFTSVYTHTDEIKMKAFNISYYSNINLPNHIGLGKRKSIGFGTQRQLKQVRIS